MLCPNDMNQTFVSIFLCFDYLYITYHTILNDTHTGTLLHWTFHRKNRRRSKAISSIKNLWINKAIFVLVLGMVLLSVLSIIFGSVYSFCSLIILQYLKNKPLGMQTLFDLMLADVVFVCDLIFGWIFIIIINLPTSPEFSQPFAIVLSGKTLLLGL